MKSETDPITDNEWLLGRVRVEQFRTNKSPLISPRAFEPRVKGREPDVTGISLYRDACLSSPTDILTMIDPERLHEYGIVRISVALLKSLNLSIVVEPNPHIAGHIVIPELNSVNYAVNKLEYGSIKELLAIAASDEANILRRPIISTE